MQKNKEKKSTDLHCSLFRLLIGGMAQSPRRRARALLLCVAAPPPLTVNAHNRALPTVSPLLLVRAQTWLLSAKYRTAATRSAIPGTRRVCSPLWM